MTIKSNIRESSGEYNPEAKKVSSITSKHIHAMLEELEAQNISMSLDDVLNIAQSDMYSTIVMKIAMES